MHLIVGIGNPGRRYQNNRHNVGFQFLDHFADKYLLKFKPSKSDYYFAEGELNSNSFVLIKPSGYVNRSGVAVLEAKEYFNCQVEDILIVVDDVYLRVSDFRIRKSGGDGGHNGLSSIIYHLNSNLFPRIRIGVGNNFEEGDLAEFVLSDFDEKEQELLNDVFKICDELVKCFCESGTDLMLSYYSRIKNLNNPNNKIDIN